MIIQAGFYNQSLPHVVVAEITRNLANRADSAHLLIEVSTIEGAATGLLQDSLVSCVLLATIDAARIDRVIGKLSLSLLQKVDVCLKAGLGLP